MIMNPDDRAALEAAAAQAAAEHGSPDWHERGQYLHSILQRVRDLERHGNVIIAPPHGAATIRTGRSTGRTALIIGELRISLTRVTFTPAEGLHPATMAGALQYVADLLFTFRFGDWDGWKRGLDEDLSESYSCRLARYLEDDEDKGGLLDVDPITAILQV